MLFVLFFYINTKMLIYETNSGIYRGTTPKPYMSEINVRAYIKYINQIDLYMV